MPNESPRQDRLLSLQFSFQQLGQLVKDHIHCLSADDSLSLEELQTVLKMHAHQHKLNKVITPTIHHSPVGSSLRTTPLHASLFSSSSTDDAKSKAVENNKSEVRDDDIIAVGHLSPVALFFLQELPDLTFIL